MKHVLNQLIQLQELNFALAEHTATSPQTPLKQLQDSINKLMEELPLEIGQRYALLQRRFPLAVVPVVHGGCAGCGLSVPVALINEIRAAEQIYACPNCGRILYFQEGLPRQPAPPAAQKRPVRAGIGRFSASELMAPKLAATSREEAIGELAKLMATHQFIEEPAVLTELALRREAMISTAVEHGLAFPHVRNVEGGSLTFALGLKPTGIKFDAPDGHLTKIIFFIVIPTPASAFYLRLLAGLVRTFSETSARKTLLECDAPEQMWKVLTTLTRETIP
jgi:mannitol/fructose-specific phosphotransferase system IIA component (Ntr-type)